MTNPSINTRVLGHIGLTVLAGIAWPFVCGLIFLHIGYDALMLQIQLLQNLGIHSGATLEAFVHITDAILWALVFGILFGLPLAVFIRKHVMRYWWLFLITVLFLAVEGELADGKSATDFISEIVFSPLPVYLFGILVVWFLTARTLSRKEKDVMQEAPAS